MVLKKVLIVNNSFPAVGLELLKKKYEILMVPYMDHDPESLPVIKNMMKGIDALVWNTKHKLTPEIVELTGSGNWRYGANWTLGRDITGSTVGVVGLGGIGQAVVRRLRGFDVATFLYAGRTEKPKAKDLGCKRVEKEKLFQESDYIILACPLTDETRHMINDDTLKLMKKTAVIVNIARGEIIDQDALYRALSEQRIFAAGLDVVTPEPMPKDHPLLSLPNCFVIPHMGSSTMETRNAMARMSAENIIHALEGKEMPHRA